MGLMKGFPAALTSSRTVVQYERGPCVNRCMRHVRARQYLTLVFRTSPPHRPSSSSPSPKVSPKRSPLSRQVKSSPGPRLPESPVVRPQSSTFNEQKSTETGKSASKASPMPVAEPEFTSALLDTADKLLIRTGNSSSGVGVERYALTECQSTDPSKAPASTLLPLASTLIPRRNRQERKKDPYGTASAREDGRANTDPTSLGSWFW